MINCGKYWNGYFYCIELELLEFFIKVVIFGSGFYFFLIRGVDWLGFGVGIFIIKISFIKWK